MAVIVTFTGYTPVPRFDGEPWVAVEIEEASEVDGTYTLIETIPLTPIDPDPENPAARSFTTALGTIAEQWYRVRFVDGDGAYSEYAEAVQNIPPDFEAEPYGTTDELARILKLRSPSVEQVAAMTRVLTAAALEIDSELGRAGAFGTPYPALVVEVNYERAVEHWQQQEAAFGIIGLGGVESVAVHTGRDTWDRHAHKLAPLKDSWGLA